MYLQYIQFALGGMSAPEIAGTVSPRAVFRTWIKGSPEPFWVKYHKHGSEMRRVSVDFAVGRVALMARCHENISVASTFPGLL
jgi:hypothetical protein